MGNTIERSMNLGCLYCNERLKNRKTKSNDCQVKIADSCGICGTCRQAQLRMMQDGKITLEELIAKGWRLPAKSKEELAKIRRGNWYKWPR